MKLLVCLWLCIQYFRVGRGRGYMRIEGCRIALDKQKKNPCVCACKGADSDWKHFRVAWNISIGPDNWVQERDFWSCIWVLWMPSRPAGRMKLDEIDRFDEMLDEWKSTRVFYFISSGSGCKHIFLGPSFISLGWETSPWFEEVYLEFHSSLTFVTVVPNRRILFMLAFSVS